MKKRLLGGSELAISELSLGGMSLPPNTQEASIIVDTAIHAGINYFDTADLYDQGANETVLGTLLKPHRQNIILATKVGNRWQQDGAGWTWDPSPPHIKQAVKESLRRLQTDYIDVYQLHGGTIDDPWAEIIDTLEDLKKEGLIREYGISSIRPNVFVPFARNSNAVSNMMQFNILDQCAAEWFTTLEQAGVSVVTRGSLAKGMLTNEWHERLKPYMNYTHQETAEVLEQLDALYDDVHAAALAFNLHFATIASTVIGARTKEQLIQTIEAYNRAQQLDDISQVLQFTKQDRYPAHR